MPTTFENMGWNLDNSYAKLPERFYTRVAPQTVSKPQLVIINEALAQDLGLNLRGVSEQQLAEIFSGNVLLKGAQPLAQAYAGHQFGQFTYLGDGRAHLIGEQITPDNKRFDIQLKGSGKTPYGRRGDGRAALEPMLREYIISEAMHALNIPSTRSLAVVTTGEAVYRETALPGAILTRVAASHIRVGSFEFLLAEQDHEGLKILADYVIARHFPEVEHSKNPYLSLLEAVIEKQAELIVQWTRVGFIHGVMNTDNMAISGETIDYGPCAFMDAYHPQTVFSSIDSFGRYSFINQPIIAQWNLARFAECLLTLLDKDKTKAIDIAEQALENFASLYEEKWLSMMRGKLGLFGKQAQDKALFLDLLTWMTQEAADYTNTFRDLSLPEKTSGSSYEGKDFQTWYARWQKRLQQNNKCPAASIALMQANNPVLIPRNHRVHQALAFASQGNLKPLEELLAAIKEPYKDYLAYKDYQNPPQPEELVKQTFCGT